MPNTAPTLSGLQLSVFMGEETANFARQLLGIDVSLSGADNDSCGAALAAGGLTGAGQVGADGAKVTCGGVIGTIAGAAGIDTAQFGGLINQYTITRTGGESNFSIAGPDGTDTLPGINNVIFFGRGGTPEAGGSRSLLP